MCAWTGNKLGSFHCWSGWQVASHATAWAQTLLNMAVVVKQGGLLYEHQEKEAAVRTNCASAFSEIHYRNFPCTILKQTQWNTGWNQPILHCPHKCMRKYENIMSGCITQSHFWEKTQNPELVWDSSCSEAFCSETNMWIIIPFCRNSCNHESYPCWNTRHHLMRSSPPFTINIM